MRILHVADLQLGFGIFDGRFSKLRERDFYSCWEALALEAVSRQTDLAVVVGDIFEGDGTKRNPITPASYNSFKRGLDILTKASIRVMVVSGNHETPRNRDAEHPLSIFNSMKNVFIVTDEPKTLDFYGFTVRAIPWIHQEPFKDSDFEPANICMVHAPCPVIDPVYGGIRQFDPEISKNYIYVALGDWHQPQTVNYNSFYCGSLERTSFTQAESKTGAVFIDFENNDIKSIDFWESPSRNMVQKEFNEENIDELNKLCNQIKDKESMIRLIFKNIDPLSVDQKLLKKIFNDFRFVKVEWKNPSSKSFTENLKSVTIQDQWREYCDLSELDKNVLTAGLEAMRNTKQ